MLHVASHSGLPLLCDTTTVGVGTGSPLQMELILGIMAQLCAVGLEASISCLPSSLTQVCGSPPDHSILYLPYPSWYPLAVREPGMFAVSSCS